MPKGGLYPSFFQWLSFSAGTRPLKWLDNRRYEAPRAGPLASVRWDAPGVGSESQPDAVRPPDLDLAARTAGRNDLRHLAGPGRVRLAGHPDGAGAVRWRDLHP